MTESKYSISNADNYLSDYEYSNAIDYVFKYIELIHQYLNYSKENMFVQELKMNKYIIIKGLELLNTTFNMLLLYTKNLDLAFYNAQKAYCYYVEFIGQIGDENNSFLKLNTKDAILFIHRKVIYNINQDMRKKFSISITDSNMMMKVKNYSTIYNNLIYVIIDKCESPFQKNNDTTLHYIIKKNTSIINKHINNDEDLNILECCEYLINELLIQDIEIIKIYAILEAYVKKHKKLQSKQDPSEIYENIKKNISTINFNGESIISKTINRIFK
jgi:hypothetical protein